MEAIQIYAHKYNLYEWGRRFDYVNVMWKKKLTIRQRMFNTERWKKRRWFFLMNMLCKQHKYEPLLFRGNNAFPSNHTSIDQTQFLIGMDVWGPFSALRQQKTYTRKQSTNILLYGDWWSRKKFKHNWNGIFIRMSGVYRNEIISK